MLNYSIEQIKNVANLLRQDAIKMITKAGSGHPAGSLGMADIFAVLYFKILNYDPKNPKWTDRDRVILSNGHICPILYASLARAGYFSLEKLDSLRTLGSALQGHPSKKDAPFIETSTGSLGHGLAVACGMAKAAKMDQKKHFIWCIMSDAEHQEGSNWEAIAFATKYQLGNLKVIVDYNGIQLSGDVKDIMPVDSLKEKYQAFGWKIFEVDGHNIEAVVKVLEEAKNYNDGPSAVLAKTIPGKGVSFMEGKWEWHGKTISKEEETQALKELENF